MGLDQYLYRREYVSAYSYKQDSNEAKREANIYNEIIRNFGVERCEDAPHLYVDMCVGYWRKANAIHDWFVKNVQDGKDECQPHYVSREQLAELKTLCERAIAARGRDFEEETSEDILPTTNGFFFGGTEYDDWYYDNLADTIMIVDRCLGLPDAWEFEYCSSW